MHGLVEGGHLQKSVGNGSQCHIGIVLFEVSHATSCVERGCVY